MSEVENIIVNYIIMDIEMFVTQFGAVLPHLDLAIVGDCSCKGG